MKKLLLSLTALFTLGVNVLVADIIAVYSWKVISNEGTNPGVWVDLYDPANYTYVPEADKYVSNDTFQDWGYTATIVVADSFSEITQGSLLVDASFVESVYEGTESVYLDGKPAKIFYYRHDADMEGVFFSHYNSTPYSTYDMSRFLRYP